jgi:hypothetical protein
VEKACDLIPDSSALTVEVKPDIPFHVESVFGQLRSAFPDMEGGAGLGVHGVGRLGFPFMGKGSLTGIYGFSTLKFRSPEFGPGHKNPDFVHLTAWYRKTRIIS